MPKRSAEEKLQRYNKKIRKLEEKVKKKHQRTIVYSDEDEIIQSEINLDVPNDEVLPPNNDSQSQETLTLDPALASSADNTQLEQLICEEITQPASEVPGTSSEPTGSELNPELLIALGASTSDAPEFGAKIHETLTNLWSPLLKKGLPKDNPRTPVLQSPKLSAERDETLFGTDLSEKIKASKAIERQGSQIKKTKQKSNSQSTASRSNQQGNWVGPPRYPSNRGGARRSENEVDSISATGGTTTSTILLEHSVQHKIYAAEDSCANPQPPLVQKPSPPALQPYPGCREALRASFARRGCPPETLTLMLASLADATIHTLSRLTETSKAPERDTTRRLTSRVSAGESEWIGATGGPPAEVVLRLHPSPADTPRVNISSLSDADGSGIVVRAEEALIVAFVLLLWVAAIALFFNRWGKIRMLEPYQPKFQQQHRQSCVLAESSVAVAPHHRASLSRGCMSYDYGSSFPTYQTCGYMAHRPRQNSVFVGSMGMALIPESPPRRSRSAADLPALVPALDVPQATPRSSRAASLHSTMDLRLYVPSPRTSRAASLNSNVEMPVQVHVRSSATNLNRPRSPRRLTITNV